MFNVENFASKSAKVGVLYPCNHFALGWKTEGLHRMMGNEMTVGPSPKVVEAVKSYADKLNWYPEDVLTDDNLREHLADYVGLPGRADCLRADGTACNCKLFCLEENHASRSGSGWGRWFVQTPQHGRARRGMPGRQSR